MYLCLLQFLSGSECALVLALNHVGVPLTLAVLVVLQQAYSEQTQALDQDQDQSGHISQHSPYPKFHLAVLLLACSWADGELCTVESALKSLYPCALPWSCYFDPTLQLHLASPLPLYHLASQMLACPLQGE